MTSHDPAPDMVEAISLLEMASRNLWQLGRNADAREVDRFLDKVSPDSRSAIDAALQKRGRG